MVIGKRICLKVKIKSARHILYWECRGRRQGRLSGARRKARSSTAQMRTQTDAHPREAYSSSVDARQASGPSNESYTRTMAQRPDTCLYRTASSKKQPARKCTGTALTKAYVPGQGHPLQPLLRNRHVWIQLSHMSLFALRGGRHRIHHLRHHSRAGPSAADHREACCGGGRGKSQQGKPHGFKPAPSARPLHANFCFFFLERKAFCLLCSTPPQARNRSPPDQAQEETKSAMHTCS